MKTRPWQGMVDLNHRITESKSVAFTTSQIPCFLNDTTLSAICQVMPFWIPTLLQNQPLQRSSPSCRVARHSVSSARRYQKTVRIQLDNSPHRSTLHAIRAVHPRQCRLPSATRHTFGTFLKIIYDQSFFIFLSKSKQFRSCDIKCLAEPFNRHQIWACSFKLII